MSSSNEVFLGQKKSIARYDLEKKKPTWSQTIEVSQGSLLLTMIICLSKTLINGKQNIFIICLMPTGESCFGQAMKLNLI